jgi:type IV secretion system protein VirB9
MIRAPATVATAAVVPQPGPGDPRIHVTQYDPDEVVVVRAVLGYQISIEFDPEERIENVAVGDALGWQITPNRKANLLFVKPMQQTPVTNMTVITNLRRYNFELSVRKPPRRPDDPSVIYTLRFIYAAPAALVAVLEPPPIPPPPPPQDVNHAYSYQGADTVLPARVFDDGHMTYFKFREGQDYPAIFIQDPAGGESIVNSFTREGFVVVDRLAPAFILRRGKEKATLINDGFAVDRPGAEAPKPRPKKSSWFR